MLYVKPTRSSSMVMNTLVTRADWLLRRLLIVVMSLSQLLYIFTGMSIIQCPCLVSYCHAVGKKVLLKTIKLRLVVKPKTAKTNQLKFNFGLIVSEAEAPKVQLELVKLKLQRIWVKLLECMSLSSTVLKVWILRAWEECLAVYLK